MLGADSVYAIQFQTILSGTNGNPYTWTTALLLVLQVDPERWEGQKVIKDLYETSAINCVTRTNNKYGSIRRTERLLQWNNLSHATGSIGQLMFLALKLS
jgi:hypothetical protein